MSALRSLNLVLRPLKLQIERLNHVGLTYPKSNWKLSLFATSLWTAFAWYLASYFSVDPKVGERSATCLVEKATSNFSVAMFVTSLAAALLYFVVHHGGGRITARNKLRWYIARFSVAFALIFSNFLSKIGAVALGVGLYAVTSDRKNGTVLIVTGLSFLFVGLVFTNYTLPLLFSVGPILQKAPFVRSLLTVAATISIALLSIGLVSGQFMSSDHTGSGCHLVIRYE